MVGAEPVPAGCGNRMNCGAWGGGGAEFMSFSSTWISTSLRPPSARAAARRTEISLSFWATPTMKGTDLGSLSLATNISRSVLSNALPFR